MVKNMFQVNNKYASLQWYYNILILTSLIRHISIREMLISKSISNFWETQEKEASHTEWKVSLFWVLLVRIFPYSDWIRRAFPVLSLNVGKYGPAKLRIRTIFTQCQPRNINSINIRIQGRITDIQVFEINFLSIFKSFIVEKISELKFPCLVNVSTDNTKVEICNYWHMNENSIWQDAQNKSYFFLIFLIFFVQSILDFLLLVFLMFLSIEIRHQNFKWK